MSGKGDRRRPENRKAFEENYERIYGQAKECIFCAGSGLAGPSWDQYVCGCLAGTERMLRDREKLG